MSTKKCVILFSGTGSNLKNLLTNEFLHSDRLKYISAFTNNPQAKGIDVCKLFNIDVKISSNKDQNIDLRDFLETYNPDLVVLSGYMKIIPDDVVKLFKGRMINIHPSLLPKYPGLNTHKKVLDSQDPYHGATIHFVSNELDGGAIILQGKFEVDKNKTEEELKNITHQVEYKIFPKVITWFANDLIKLEFDKVFFKGKEVESPIVYIHHDKK